MSKFDKITILGNKEKDYLMAKSAAVLPKNPSEQGWSAERILRTLHEPLQVIFKWLQQTQDQTNEEVNRITNDIDNILNEIEALQLRASTLEETTNVTHVNRFIAIEQDISNIIQTATDLVTNLLSGASIVNKTKHDQEGNVIDDTYASKIGIGASTSPTDKKLTIRIYTPKQDRTQATPNLSSVTYTIDSATPSAAGLMSASDKAKLNAVEDTYIKKETISQPNGIAPLNEQGYIPSQHLPSYVDDVVEIGSSQIFQSLQECVYIMESYFEVGATIKVLLKEISEATEIDVYKITLTNDGNYTSEFVGYLETDKIYVSLLGNVTYRYPGLGKALVEISKSLAIGETSSTAYRGDRGKNAYDHSKENGNPHGTNSGQIPYNNLKSGLTSNTVKGAIDEVNDKFAEGAEFMQVHDLDNAETKKMSLVIENGQPILRIE